MLKNDIAALAPMPDDPILGLVSLYESENEQAAEWFRGLALRKLMRFTEAEQVLQEIEAAKKLSPNDFRIYAFEQIKDTF